MAPSWIVSVSASVNLSLHHIVQKFYSGTGSPRLSWKKGRKTVVVVVVQHLLWYCSSLRQLYSDASANAFSALTLLVGHWEEHPACKKIVW